MRMREAFVTSVGAIVKAIAHDAEVHAVVRGDALERLVFQMAHVAR